MYVIQAKFIIIIIWHEVKSVSSRASNTCQMYFISNHHIKVPKHNKSLKSVCTSPINTQRVLHTKTHTCCIWRHGEDCRERNTQHLFIFPFLLYLFFFFYKFFNDNFSTLTLQEVSGHHPLFVVIQLWFMNYMSCTITDQLWHRCEENTGSPYTGMHILKCTFVASHRRGDRNLNTLTTTCAAYLSLLSMQLSLWLMVTLRDTKWQRYIQA